MRQTLTAWLKFAVALSVLVSLTSRADNAGGTPEAQAWLTKIQTAAQRLNYSGTFVYQQGSQMRTSRITHLLEGGTEIEKLEILDGNPREYIRKNDEVICYVPETRTLQVEKRVSRDAFPAILGASPAELAQHYHIRKAETGRIAGHDCQAIILEPKDKLRYGYKLWAEKSSGLLLRAQTLNDRAEVVEQIAFTQVAIGNVDRSRVNPSYVNTAGWRVEHAVTTPANLHGWTVGGLPPGFRKVRELKRVVSDGPADGATNVPQTAGREIGQMIFSDGLAAISVFIEPGSYSRTEGTLQQGALNILGKRYGDYWLTIVGEVPSAAIRQVANSIEYQPK
ncbi:MAG TPA: MucB/RseB C-terminal domain-containing protein [Noviherbaspirillum sp.]|nr:MucB/RseB C-terminal domain-containing protein [Noviherbaspirillum sp.]